MLYMSKLLNNRKVAHVQTNKSDRFSPGIFFSFIISELFFFQITLKETTGEIKTNTPNKVPTT